MLYPANRGGSRWEENLTFRTFSSACFHAFQHPLLLNHTLPTLDIYLSICMLVCRPSTPQQQRPHWPSMHKHLLTHQFRYSNAHVNLVVRAAGWLANDAFDLHSWWELRPLIGELPTFFYMQSSWLYDQDRNAKMHTLPAHFAYPSACFLYYVTICINRQWKIRFRQNAKGWSTKYISPSSWHHQVFTASHFLTTSVSF